MPSRRILFVTSSYSPAIGGVERHLQGLVKELKDDHVTILTLQPSLGAPARERLGHAEVIRAPKVHLPLMRRAAINLFFLRHLKLFLQADIIHYHDYAPFLYWSLPSALLSLAARKKVYMTFHGWEGRFPPSPWVIRCRRFVEKLVHGNLCAGHFIEKWYGTKADQVTYGAVTLPRTQPNPIAGRACFIGRLEEDTGIEMILKAWPNIVQSVPEASLVICGDGSLAPKLKEWVAAHCPSSVTFLGNVKEPEAERAAATVVFASGYLSLLEALAMKKAVIATYDHALRKDYWELVPNSKELFWSVGTHEEVEQAFLEALKDTQKGEKGAAFAAKSSWAALKNQYEALWSI